jgi:hypothetical protein
MKTRILLIFLILIGYACNDEPKKAANKELTMPDSATVDWIKIHE